MAVDGDGNAYITGNHTTATGLECVTLKYSTNGELLWSASFNGPDQTGGVLISIALDDLANVYVSGFLRSIMSTMSSLPAIARVLAPIMTIQP